MAVESTQQSRLWSIPTYVGLHQADGFFYVTGHMCQFGLRHPVSRRLIQKAFKLLTNAPWMARMGKLCCCGQGTHHRLQGHDVALSSEYPWKFCEEYAQALKNAPFVLASKQKAQYGITKPDEWTTVVQSASINAVYPNVPLTYLRGSLLMEWQNRQNPLVMAPTLRTT